MHKNKLLFAVQMRKICRLALHKIMYLINLIC